MGSIIANGKINVYSPSTGKLINTLKESSHDAIDSATYPSEWSEMTTQSRVRLIKLMRRMISNHSDDLIDIIIQETGKKEFEALMEVFVTLEHLRSIEKNAHRYIRSRSRSTGLFKIRKARVRYEPLGVAGIISPWNYPLILTLCPAIEALVSGNSVVLKPSEHTPGTTQMLKKLWDISTGFPDILIPVYGGADIGHAIIQSNNIHVICFTGSTSVGRIVAAECGKLLKPCILELGGKDPMIVLDDADIDRAVDAAVWGSMSNAGQTCISVERILVQNSIFSMFSNKLKEGVVRLRAGSNKSDSVGAITIPAGLDKISSHTELYSDSQKFVGQSDKDHGNYYPPTVIEEPSYGDKIFNEETFGPVVTIERFSDDLEAIEKANMTRFGLAASIFGRNRKRMRMMSRHIIAGNISFNDIQTHYGIAALPFGGVKDSGLGRLHGKEGVRSFCYIKTITENRLQFKNELWWYSNQHWSSDWIKRIIKKIY